MLEDTEAVDYHSTEVSVDRDNIAAFDRKGTTAQYQRLHDREPCADQIVYETKLNPDTEDELGCSGYADSALYQILFYITVVLSGGIILLPAYWYPAWYAQMTKRKSHLPTSSSVIIQEEDGMKYVQRVKTQRLSEASTFEVNVGDCDAENSSSVSCDPTPLFYYFDHKHVRYYWDYEENTFVKLRGFDNGEMTCGEIHDKLGEGITERTHRIRLQKYGDNSIVVQVKSYATLFFSEALNPFYIFQIASIVLWSLDQYYVYAGCIFLISSVSLSVETYQIHKQSVALRNMVASKELPVTVYRPLSDTMDRAGTNLAPRTVQVPASQLVPGDVLVLPSDGCVMMCDAVLMAGNVIVNESMLTGESVPVTKTPLNPSQASELYSADTHRKHTLFCGTQVIQTRYYGDTHVTAVVVRTGFSTSKGELVRSILFPKPFGFKFYQDAMKFIGFLAFMSLLGMAYSVRTLIQQHKSWGTILIRSLDIITIVVPPALPAAMTIGTVYAQSRLKKKNIYCISPARINTCGKLKLICFDKTGTLTEDGLDMWGVLPLEQGVFKPVVHTPTDMNPHSHMTSAMATCHSLTIINHEITGDPLDLKMFNSINFILEEPGQDTSKFDNLIPTVVRPVSKQTYVDVDDGSLYELGIIRQFTFSSSLQRMSVITRVLEATNMVVYCKGAPEKIESLCNKQSLPLDLYDKLHQYTGQGFRVIALAYKQLDDKVTWHQVQRMSRDKVESDLEFLGLLIMENTLKPETTPVIKELNSANIRTVMVTGDNVLTALSVAHQCHMIGQNEEVVMVEALPPEHGKSASVNWKPVTSELSPGNQEATNGQLYQNTDVSVNITKHPKYHFVVTGKSFAVIREYFPELVPRISVWGTVYARMSPEQKMQLIENLQELGYYVGMCGDGANDCSALKAAHAGISLSDAEASIASPFTSRTPNIQCVPTVIREGRAALVTSFAVFKYMALYSMIQFVSVLILYSNETNLGDWMFLYVDLLITTTVAVLMGRTEAFSSLVERRPQGSLVSPVNLFSIVTHIFWVVAFQVGAYVFLINQPWYVPLSDLPEMTSSDSDKHVHKCSETTVIFLVSAYQYIILAFCFSKGPPYRQPIWTNVPYLVMLVVLIGLNTLLLLYPLDFLSYILELQAFPDDAYNFRLILLAIVLGHFLAAVFTESLVVPSKLLKQITNKIRCKRHPKNKYKMIQSEMESEANWPPVGTVSMAAHHEYNSLSDENLNINGDITENAVS